MRFRLTESLSDPNTHRQRAIELFGTTLSPEKAGYLLPDGTFLNFENTNNRRGYDADYFREMGDHINHHEIYEVFIEDGIDIDPLQAIEDFVNEGNIRFGIQNEKGSDNFIQISSKHEPTSQQYEKIKEAAEVTFDKGIVLWVGYGKTGEEFSPDTPPEQVVSNIKYFYTHGQKRNPLYKYR